MFYEKISFFNSKIKDLDSLSKKEIEFFLSEALTIIEEYREKLELELSQRQILNKISYLNYSLQKDINEIKSYRIDNNFILILLKNNKTKKIKLAKTTKLIEKLFFIDRKDDLYKILFFMFSKEENFLLINLYNYNNF